MQKLQILFMKIQFFLQKNTLLIRVWHDTRQLFFLIVYSACVGDDSLISILGTPGPSTYTFPFFAGCCGVSGS